MLKLLRADVLKAVPLVKVFDNGYQCHNHADQRHDIQHNGTENADPRDLREHAEKDEQNQNKNSCGSIIGNNGFFIRRDDSDNRFRSDKLEYRLER